MNFASLYTEALSDTTWTVPQNYDACFNWVYDTGRAGMMGLYQKGKEFQWDATTRIDWSQELDEAIARVPAHWRLVRPGYLPFADLPGFLGGAIVVAAPSRGEGFGLPVLEAMACGAPVLTTYRTSLPEVGGDAVAYTEPDAGSIAFALRALLDDPVRRAALSEAGYARAAEFTWAASAAAHVASYRRAVEQRTVSASG